MSWYHIKLKAGDYKDAGILSKITFWLGGDKPKDIRDILYKKYKVTKEHIEFIKKKKPPFV